MANFRFNLYFDAVQFMCKRNEKHPLWIFILFAVA